MRSESLINRRNKLIYERYSSLWGSGQREELIWPVLTNEFHLEQPTIYRIILKMIKEANKVSSELPFNGEESCS